MPVEKMVMEKNSITQVTQRERNAVLILLAICRTVNTVSPRR